MKLSWKYLGINQVKAKIIEILKEKYMILNLVVHHLSSIL
jgi:hypothetical protein